MVIWYRHIVLDKIRYFFWSQHTTQETIYIAYRKQFIECFGLRAFATYEIKLRAGG